MNVDFITTQINEAIAKIQSAKDQELQESIATAETQLIAPRNAEFTAERDRAVEAAQKSFEYAKTVAWETCEQKKAAAREEIIAQITKAVDEKYAETITKLTAALPNE